MRAIDDSVVTVNYLDPALNGFTSVWSGSLIILPGWVEITLNDPFFLPAGKNLEIVWFHRHGSFANTAHTWAHSQTTNLMTAFAQNNTSFPLSSGATSYYRPNIKLDTKAPFVPYQVKNLGLIALPSPSNSLAFGCEPDYSTVSLIVGNLGAVDYDFSNDSLVIHLEIVDPFLTKSTEEIVISTGILLSGTQDVLELMSAFPIKYAGRYEIKAWVENALDNIPYDDTLFYLYTSGRIGLPVDEDFSGTILPDAFISTPVIGTDVWETYDDPLSPVMPFYGTGTLRYVGVQGSMAQLSIRQLDLNGSINPKLEFWYYHDSAASDMDRSYTDVNVIADGVLTTELSMFRKDVPNGWKYYFVDLTPYVGKECVLIEFVATNRFGTTSAQYIDRITVISTPDLAVSSIVVSPEISVCSLTNKDVSVTLNTIVNQEINFSNSGCNLAIEVPNYPPFIVSLQGSMIGNSSRTITIPNIDFSMGKHLLKAYLTVPVDNYPLNDTAYLEIEIRPELSLTTKSLTGGIDCFKIGADVQQEITLVNTGNMDLSNIALTVQIDTGETGSPTYAFYNETYTDTIHVGDSITYTFSNTYKAPSSATYYVRNTAYLLCDPLLVYVIDAITECSDIHDLAIVRLDNPSALRDVVGTSENVAVSITNMSDVKNFDNVNIMLMIEDENGLTISSRIGIIPSVGALSTLSFTFNEAYIVPDSAVYYIRVYLSSVDNYPENDTLFEQRTTTTVDITSIATADNLTLGQNIPNPAANATRIDYSIPEADEVIFELYSISGQLLYSRTIEAVKGKQSLEINTSTLSSGIYFYTVEYRGQRLVKRMSVNRK
jgi:hypothetical protein